MTHNICKTCGGNLTRVDEYTWICSYCKNTYEDTAVKKDTDMLRAFLDEQKMERVSNLRRRLYDAVSETYTDSEEIMRICAQLKDILPDDFMADFYYTANGGDIKRTAEYITRIDADEHIEYVEGIIGFLLKSFTGEYHLPLAGLIERAYRGRDLEKLERFNTMLSEESEKENAGVYESSLTRDVFVAYSGKDMEYVYPLVSYLESSGLTCFVAARNLRHGRGAVQNYGSAIKEAISNCKSVVLVSSQNSRSFSCDTLRFELPYIKQEDVNNAPYEYRQNYFTMPQKYKKPRVEYRLEESKSPNAADVAVKEFFSGCEYAYTPEETAVRVIKMLFEEPKKEPPAHEYIPDIKESAKPKTSKKGKQAREESHEARKARGKLVMRISLIASVLGCVLSAFALPSLFGFSFAEAFNVSNIFASIAVIMILFFPLRLFMRWSFTVKAYFLSRAFRWIALALGWLLAAVFAVAASNAVSSLTLEDFSSFCMFVAAAIASVVNLIAIYVIGKRRKPSKVGAEE